MIEAVEAGDLSGMKELLDTANHYDVNLANKVCRSSVIIMTSTSLTRYVV